MCIGIIYLSSIKYYFNIFQEHNLNLKFVFFCEIPVLPTVVNQFAFFIILDLLFHTLPCPN